MSTTAGDGRSRFRSPITEPGYRAGIPSPNKGKSLPVETLTPDEVDRLMRAANNGITGRRTRAVIAVLYRAGLRVGECCNLRPIDVNYEDCTIRVLRGKTANADRMVGIDPFALEYVADWQELRAELGVPRMANLFCTVVRDHLGHPLSTAQIRNTLRGLADKAGIEKRVHPHGFRHSHASELAREQVDIRVIKTQLGHSNVAITDRYISHLYPGEAISVMRGRTWLGGEPE